MKDNESRNDYIKEVFHAIGIDKCRGNLRNIDTSTNLAYNYADGGPCIYVFRRAMPDILCEHFTTTAMSLNNGYKQCATRRVRTVHLGPKEFNPGENQSDFYSNEKRIWTLDANVQKEHVTTFLPELLFADKVLSQVSPRTHYKCLTVKSKYRLATTAFTQIAVNSSECSIHRDFCFGLDVLLYGGDWIGGALELPQLDIKIELQKGDIVVMDSGIFHQVERIAGTRFSAVFFTKNHNEISNSGNELKVPENLSWLSQKYFGIISTGTSQV